MGKKKEISTAADEASRREDKSKQQQTPPRKRGRPRKIVQKTEIQEDIEKRHQPASPEDKDSSIKKEEEEEKIALQGLPQEGSIISSTCTGAPKEERVSPDMQPSSRSRARRKSIPRRSC